MSLLAAIPVAFAGTTGFVGRVGPHIARLVLGEDQRFLAGEASFATIQVGSYSPIIKAQRRIAGPRDCLRTWIYRGFVLTARKS